MEMKEKVTVEIMKELREIETLSMVGNEITWGFTIGNGGILTKVCC